MTGWVTCAACDLKHAHRQDARCPRCGSSLLGAAGATNATPPKSWKEAVANIEARDRPIAGIGDAADEHLSMTRGRYSAWLYVIFAFILQTAMTAYGGIVIVDGIFGRAAPRWLVAIIALLSLAITPAIYWDRWRCIEARASNYCTGIVNISLVIVVPVVMAYSTYRGVAKLWGK